MVDTIFSPSFGNRPTQLVGREAVLRQLADGLATRPGSRERATLLLGQRGSGKTVLLLEMSDQARARGFAVASPTTTSADMSERIIEKLTAERERLLGPRLPELTEAGVSALGVSASIKLPKAEPPISFQGRLSSLVREFNSHAIPVLVLIDEVQANSEPIRRLVIAYQELTGERADIALGMAGLPGAISATLNDHVLTFLNRANKVRLEPIPIGDVNAFYAQSFEQLGIPVDPVPRHLAAQSTQGSPYMLQLVGHRIVLRATPHNAVQPIAVEEAIESATEDFEADVCATTLNALSDRDAAFLQAMSEDRGRSRVSEVAVRLGVTSDYAQKYRKRLIGSGVIEAAGRGYVQFAVPYMRDHLRRQAELA